MKKIKVLLSALAMVAAMALVSCGGKAGDDGTSSPAATGETVAFTMTYKANGQYAAPTFTVADDWKSIEVVFADGTDFDKIQFAVTSDSIKAKQDWGNEYYAMYPAATKTSTIVLNDYLEVNKDESDKTLKDYGATKITAISIQNKTKEALTVKVVSAKVTKADGSVVDVKPVGDWGSTVN